MKKFMSLMLLVCACLLSQPVKAQQVTPDNAGYIVKVVIHGYYPDKANGSNNPSLQK